MRHRRRGSSAVSYVHPVYDRRNLRVVTQAMVQRIVIEGGKAVAVDVSIAGSREVTRIRVEREVIVASGAIGSPKLLMLSGIGPADELRAVGVDPVHDLKGVGKNLQDHLDVYAVATLKKPMSYDGEDRLLPMLKHGLRYLLTKTGPVTSNVCEGGAFVSSVDDTEWPDNQMHFLPAYVVDHGRMKIEGHGMTLNTAYLRPEARGTVTLRSANPLDAPLIDPNFLGVEEDLKRSINCFKMAREIFAQPALSGLIEQEYLPGSDCKTDSEIADYVREWSKTDYHPVGTCKMGSDDMAVVDTQLRVHGLDGLRVIDSSIMPTLVSGNTNAPSIMIGEKGAAIVLAGEVV